MADSKLVCFCLVFLVPVVAHDIRNPDKRNECFTNGFGVDAKTVAGGICVLSTTNGFIMIGNEDLVTDERARALTQTWQITDYDESWKLEVYPMMHGTESIFGWFHVVLTGDPNTAGIVIIMAVQDDKKAYSPPAGQFYWSNSKQGTCTESPAQDVTKAKFVPCSYAADPLPFAGRIFVDIAKGNRRLASKYELNFRAILPRCNLDSDNKIYIRALVIGSLRGANELRYAMTKQLGYTERVTYVVAVDPFPPTDGMAQCSASNMPPWVSSITDVTGKKIPIQNGDRSCTSEGCFTGHYWEGRCQPYDRGLVHYNFCYICEDKVAAGNGNESLEDYYKDYVQRVRLATTVCGNETNCTDTLNQRERFGEDVGSPIGKYIWGARKGHGVLMSVASFLAYPLSAYFARYYKETYMKTRAVINLHVWYAAHICGSFIVLSFIISGTGVGIYGRLFYGHSISMCGVAHRHFGWLGAAMFVVGMVTSGFRIAPIPIRKITIFVHFLAGMSYQVLNWLSMITCACIPGSPPGTELTDKGEAGPFALFWVLTIVWLVFEIAMNILATLQICQADKASQFMPRRKLVFGLIYMPSLTPDSTKDLVGKERRKFLLQIYILGNSIITILALVLIIYPDDKGRYFGIMELTHFRNGSNRFADNYDEYAEIDE